MSGHREMGPSQVQLGWLGYWLLRGSSGAFWRASDLPDVLPPTLSFDGNDVMGDIKCSAGLDLFGDGGAIG